MKLRHLPVVAGFCLVGCSSVATRHDVIHDSIRGPAQTADAISLFYTPEDLHRTWLNSIQVSQKSIFMEMFHLTDPDVVNALLAKSPDVQITLILDSGNLKDPVSSQIAATLIKNANIKIYPSSGPPAGFMQTHTKAAVFDGTSALITSINLTNNASIQRDYGIVSQDPEVIAEMTSVFNADLQNSLNAQNKQTPVRYTPAGVGQGKLIWSPIDSESRLVSLIEEASQIPEGPKKFLYATVENLGDAAIQSALSKAAENGVKVEMIVPQCVLGANGPRNYGFFPYLKSGVAYKVMPHPSSATQPYMHGKMMVLGNGRGYVGSVNYSKNSTQGNRELGIIFTNQQVSDQLTALFLGDWGQAQTVLDPTSKPTCPTDTTNPGQ